MRAVAEYRKNRADQQRLGKFHIGHLPVGTVVEVEYPGHDNFIKEEDRVHPDEMYGRKQLTIVKVYPNGENSYVFDYTEWSALGADLSSMNINWIRRIVSRGTGKLTDEDQAKVDQFAKDRLAYMAERHPNWTPHTRPLVQGNTLPTNGNRYRFWYVAHFVQGWMTERGYYDDHCQHLYDVDFIIESIVPHFTRVEGAGWSSEYTISKKRFAKVMKHILAKAAKSRRVAAAITAAEEWKQYEHDMAHDYD